MVDALAEELAIRQNYLPNKHISTIYFGGGTPSLLEPKALGGIINAIKQLYSVDADAEITLEANPDDITNEMVLGWMEAGVNRLSIGVQSFRDEDLKWMNRSHGSNQALSSIAIAQEMGITNISMDLIYALPALSDAAWLRNIQTAISTGIQHFSCYCLTVEEKTKLNQLIKTAQTPDVDEDQSARQFAILMDEMQNQGFEHYESSNFAKPRFRSRHNSNYWNRVPYIGIGPSAHSFDGASRQWNISSNTAYLKGIANKDLKTEREDLSIKDQFNETIMTRLRTNEGLALADIQQRFEAEFINNIETQMPLLIKQGLLEQTNNYIKLTREGKFLADDVAARLFQ